jgi:hypothetical protein
MDLSCRWVGLSRLARRWVGFRVISFGVSLLSGLRGRGVSINMRNLGVSVSRLAVRRLCVGMLGMSRLSSRRMGFSLSRRMSFNRVAILALFVGIDVSRRVGLTMGMLLIRLVRRRVGFRVIRFGVRLSWLAHRRLALVVSLSVSLVMNLRLSLMVGLMVGFRASLSVGLRVSLGLGFWVSLMVRFRVGLNVSRLSVHLSGLADWSLGVCWLHMDWLDMNWVHMLLLMVDVIMSLLFCWGL